VCFYYFLLVFLLKSNGKIIKFEFVIQSNLTNIGIYLQILKK
jgi:hypothetical protein